MTLQTGNPYKREVPNVSNRELEQRVQGLFKNWYTQGNKQDYMSGFPTLLGIEPNKVDKIEPFQYTNKESGAESYTETLNNSNEDDIIIVSGVVVSTDKNLKYEFTNEDDDYLYGPIFVEPSTKSELNGPNKLIPNYKGKDLEIELSTTGRETGAYSIAVQGGVVTVSSSDPIELNPGIDATSPTSPIS